LENAKGVTKPRNWGSTEKNRGHDLDDMATMGGNAATSHHAGSSHPATELLDLGFSGLRVEEG